MDSTNSVKLTDSKIDIEKNGDSSKVYRRRFWIVAIFSILSFFQSQQWNHWGAIEASMQAAFPGWDAGTVAMLANWGPITFVIFVVPMTWLMSINGFRFGVVSSAFVIAVGTGLRCLSFSAVPFTVLCHLGAILIGTAGTVMLAGPSLLAADWFPPKERTTAMAVPVVLNQLGSACSGFETFLVKDPDDGVSNEDIRNEVKKLLVIEFVLGFGIFLTVLAYFPSKPPSPPSITSTAERSDYKTSIKSIARNRDLLLIFLSCAFSSVPWESVLNYYLSTLGIHQDEASHLGTIAIAASAFSALLSARFTDILYGHVRLTLLILILSTVGFLYWLCLLTWGTIPPVKWQIYVTIIGGMAVNFAQTPLFYELAVETAYPCPESLVSGLLLGTLNFTGIIFLAIFFIPGIGYDWVVYYFLASSIFCMLPLLFIKEEYVRSTIDKRLSKQ